MLLVAVAIIGVIAGILAPVMANKLDDAQIRAEAATLKSLRMDFEGTYDAVDYNNLNEASVAASGLPLGTVLTTFDQGTGIESRIYGQTVIVDPAGWVTKLAQKRGVSSYVIGATYSALTQSQYTAIAFNPYQVQRCLVVGPTGETGQQRYLLMSLMAPPYRSAYLFHRGFDSDFLTQFGTRVGNQFRLKPRRCGTHCSVLANTRYGTQLHRTTGRTLRDCLLSGLSSQSMR